MPKGEIVGIKLFAISDNTFLTVQTEKMDLVLTEFGRLTRNSVLIEFGRLIKNAVLIEWSFNWVKMEVVLTE